MKPDHITIFTVAVVVVVASYRNFLNTDISGIRYDMNPPINLQVVLILKYMYSCYNTFIVKKSYMDTIKGTLLSQIYPMKLINVSVSSKIAIPPHPVQPKAI